VSDQAGIVVSQTVNAVSDFTPSVSMQIPPQRLRLWSPDDPHLYDLKIELMNEEGTVLDSARSYAGMRSISIEGKAVKLNGNTLFQRLVLDQGYYPEGLMTAPSDEDLIQDIRLSQSVGFNGARLHQKVFEERFLFHADRMGYLVWGEFGDWGARGLSSLPHHQRFSPAYITEWLEVLQRDYSHPSIIG
jgi:beta-galactosidase/beta-glucuronidase